MSDQTTNNIKNALDKASGVSFFLSTLASKIQYLPLVTLTTPFLNLISLTFSLFGYSVWYVGSYFYPNQLPKNAKWYGFAPFKEQNTYAAFIGIGAAIISMIAIAIPIMAIPAAWLFFSSNVVWVIGEYHKLKHPPADENYSDSFQRSYLSYALSLTSVGLITALAATFVFIFPLQTIPILAIAGISSIALSLVAAEHWLNFNFSEHKKMPTKKASYDKMSHGLGPSFELVELPSSVPYHGPKLREEHKPTIAPIEDDELIDQDSSTCNQLC